jgi:hypothetical protein
MTQEKLETFERRSRNFLSELRGLYPHSMRHDLKDVHVMFYDLTCYLVQITVNSTSLVDLTIFRDLFNVSRTPDENADIFLGLGELVTCLATDLFTEDAKHLLTPILPAPFCPLCKDGQPRERCIVEVIICAIFGVKDLQNWRRF